MGVAAQGAGRHTNQYDAGSVLHVLWKMVIHDAE
jgi:hypothetical protein